ncbi:MAG TPA: TMEM175 family protein, partial [Usitatibacter sp.]|nr:TMEM175 family protein [Usitatibacter sp.]
GRESTMGKGRLEAFSDGVIAVIITVMVLEMKVPHGTDFDALSPLVPVFLSYVLSYVFVGIYWNNHHHLLHATDHINGTILWANLHLLFWLSLIPFVTAWMSENHFDAWPVALYGVVLLFSAIAYFLLAHCLISHHGKDSALAASLGRDVKGKASVLIYLCAIPLAFVRWWVACALYVVVAALWFVPDRRIEGARRLQGGKS